MTQTSNPQSFIADHATVSTEMVFGDPISTIEVKSGAPAWQATTARVHLSSHAAQFVLAQLAEQLGFTLVSKDAQQEFGKLFRETIAAADDRKTEILETGRGIGLADLSRMTDDMRDLRDELRRADIISG